ncbi:hypothetical protein D3C73_1252170 [compost metagenome]
MKLTSGNNRHFEPQFPRTLDFTKQQTGNLAIGKGTAQVINQLLLGLGFPLHHLKHAIVFFHLQQAINGRHPVQMFMTQCSQALNILFDLCQLGIEGGYFIFATKTDNRPE